MMVQHALSYAGICWECVVVVGKWDVAVRMGACSHTMYPHSDCQQALERTAQHTHTHTPRH